MTDKEIIYLYNSGQREQAFNHIVKDYSERLYLHIRRFVYSHDDANDLTQEVRAAFYVDIPYRNERGIQLSSQTEASHDILLGLVGLDPCQKT